MAHEPEHRGRFSNPPGSPQGTATTLDFLQFLRGRLLSAESAIHVPEGHVLSDKEAAESWEAVNGDKLQWLGHSAFRWCVGGTVFMSDPLLTDWASPVTWMGPKRFIPSPLKPQDAACDLILITHCHYDHLDLRTLANLPNKKHVHVIAPVGVGRILHKAGLRHIDELNWNQSAKMNGLKVTLVPAVHFASRTPWDRNKSLWGGFVIEHGDRRFYLSGDTGYHPEVFRKIGEQHGPFDYGLVPIGAYEPRSIMVEHHVTPEEGVTIGRDVGAKTLVAHHWGALRLTTEDPFEPPDRFYEASSRMGYERDHAWLLKVGETRALI